MDPQRKLELMKRYDFKGFGSANAAIGIYASLFDAGMTLEDGEHRIARMRSCRGRMEDFYSQIDFEELEREVSGADREDFQTLFLVRSLLPQMGAVIEKFVERARSCGHRVSASEGVGKEIEDLRRQILNADYYRGIRYRERIEILERSLRRETTENSP